MAPPLPPVAVLLLKVTFTRLGLLKSFNMAPPLPPVTVLALKVTFTRVGLLLLFTRAPPLPVLVLLLKVTNCRAGLE